MKNFKFKIILTIASIIFPVTFAYCGFLEWYDYYKEAEKYTKEEKYREASEEYQLALGLKDVEKTKVKTYGMNFIDYFPHRGLGIAYYNLKEYQNAKEELEISIKMSSTDLAKEYLSRIEQALIKETKLQEQVENAISLFKKGNFDASIVTMTEVLKSNPENADAKVYIERANTIKQEMKILPKQKQTQITKTIPIPKTEDKKNFDDFKIAVKSSHNKALDLFNKGEYKKAATSLEDILTIIEGKDGLEKEIISTKEQITEINTKLAELKNKYINDAKNARNLSKEIGILKSAIKILPETKELKDMLSKSEAKISKEVVKLYFKGVDLYSADKFSEAIAVWKDALELNPEHSRIKTDIARAEDKLKSIMKVK